MEIGRVHEQPTNSSRCALCLLDTNVQNQINYIELLIFFSFLVEAKR